MIEFLESLHAPSILCGVIIAYGMNLVCSLEQFILECWAFKYQQKKSLIDLRKKQNNPTGNERNNLNESKNFRHFKTRV